MNNSARIPISGIVILILMLVIVTLVSRILFPEANYVICDRDENKVLHKGILRGFSKVEYRYWAVTLNNRSIIYFSVFDSDYMQSLLGERVIINCCIVDGLFYQDCQVYDFVSAFIDQ
jgi:hypothetical protein